MTNLCILPLSFYHHYTKVSTLAFIVFVSMNPLMILLLSHKNPAKSAGLPDMHSEQ